MILMLRHEFSANSVTCDIAEQTSAGREAAREKEASALADHESSHLSKRSWRGVASCVSGKSSPRARSSFDRPLLDLSLCYFCAPLPPIPKFRSSASKGIFSFPSWTLSLRR